MKCLLIPCLLLSALLLASCEPVYECRDLALSCDGASAFYQCGKYVKEFRTNPDEGIRFSTNACLEASAHDDFFCPVGDPSALSDKCEEAIHITCELIKDCP